MKCCEPVTCPPSPNIVSRQFATDTPPTPSSPRLKYTQPPWPPPSSKLKMLRFQNMSNLSLPPASQTRPPRHACSTLQLPATPHPPASQTRPPTLHQSPAQFPEVNTASVSDRQPWQQHLTPSIFPYIYTMWKCTTLYLNMYVHSCCHNLPYYIA